MKEKDVITPFHDFVQNGKMPPDYIFQVHRAIDKYFSLPNAQRLSKNVLIELPYLNNSASRDYHELYAESMYSVHGILFCSEHGELRIRPGIGRTILVRDNHLYQFLPTHETGWDYSNSIHYACMVGGGIIEPSGSDYIESLKNYQGFSKFASFASIYRNMPLNPSEKTIHDFKESISDSLFNTVSDRLNFIPIYFASSSLFSPIILESPL